MTQAREHTQKKDTEKTQVKTDLVHNLAREY